MNNNAVKRSVNQTQPTSTTLKVRATFSSSSSIFASACNKNTLSIIVICIAAYTGGFYSGSNSSSLTNCNSSNDSTTTSKDQRSVVSATASATKLDFTPHLSAAIDAIQPGRGYKPINGREKTWFPEMYV